MDYKVNVNGVVNTYHTYILKQYVERRNELSYCLLSAEAIEPVMKNFSLMIALFRQQRSRNHTMMSIL